MIKKPLVNTLVQILGKVGMVGISLLTTGVLTRKLGLTNYGNFVLISSLFIFLDALADFGTKTIGVREIVRPGGEKVVNQVFNLRLIMTTVAFGLGLWLIWQWKGVAEMRLEATVALLMIFLTSIAGFWEMIFQSRMRMDLKIIVDLSFPLLFLVWLWQWQGKINLLLVVSAYLIARAISLGIGVILVKTITNYELRITNKINWTEIKEFWNVTWPMGLFLMMFVTYDRAIDSLLIQNFLGAAQVAWYGLAYKIYGVLLQPAYFYISNIFPMMGAKETNKKKLFVESAIIMVAASVVLVVGTWIMAPIMINVLGGGAFGPSVQALRVLIIAALFSYMGHLVGFTLISEGGQKEMLRLGVVALVSNLILNLIFIPRYGLMAAAWVTVFTEAIGCGMMMLFLRAKTLNSKL